MSSLGSVIETYNGSKFLKTKEQGVAKSAFGEILFAQLSPIFQLSFEYTVSNTKLIDTTVTNGGTVTQANAMAVLGTSTTTNSTAHLDSKVHAKYRAGQGGLIRFTSIFTSPVAGTSQHIGIVDETGSTATFKNGYTVGYVGTTFGYHRFQNDTITTVALANFDDPLDGTGASGMTVDLTKLNVWEIRYQYLGGGAIQICIEDDSTGRFVVVHTEQYANRNTAPSVYNPNFHFVMYVDNGATSSDIVLKTASCAYFIEGLSDFILVQRAKSSSGSQSKTTVTTEVAMFTVRNKTSYASKTNFIDTVVDYFSASIEASSANNLGTIRLVKNATLGGSPSYSDINTTDSVLDIDTAGTTVTGGTELIAIEMAGKNDRVFQNLYSLNILLNPGDTVTMAVSSENSATFKGSMLFEELF